MTRGFEIDDLFIGPLPEEPYRTVAHALDATNELDAVLKDRAVELAARALYGQRLSRQALSDTQEHLDRRRIDRRSGLLTPDEWAEQVERKIDVLNHGQRAHDPDSALLLQFDAEGFKEINDRLGHLEGHRIIGVIAGYLKHHARTDGGDIIGRLGGDEFGWFVSFKSSRMDAVELLINIEERLLDFAPEKYPDMPLLRWNHAIYKKGDDLGDMLARAEVKNKEDEGWDDRVRSHKKSLAENQRALELALAG